MFKTLKKGPTQENTHSQHNPVSSSARRSDSSSSNHTAHFYNSSTTNLQPPTQQYHHHHGHQTIPMETLSSRANIYDRNDKATNQFEHEHDPLPPAVDFTNVQPTARYQFRALARRALSYHRRQRSTNICCLVLWPVILVLLCFIFSIVMGSGRGSGRMNGTVDFCSKDADPQKDTVFGLDSASPGPVAWYPSGFSGRTFSLPCVRWFGESYPSKAPYENATAASLSQPDSYYQPPPTGGWFNVQQLKDDFRKNNPMGRSPALWNMYSINQTVYYTTANAQVAQWLGIRPNVTQRFYSDVWPPVNAVGPDGTSISPVVYNVSGLPVTAQGSGILGAIPVRYTSKQTEKPNAKGDQMSSYFTNYFTVQSFIGLPNVAAIEKQIDSIVQTMSQDHYYDSYANMPFGGIEFQAADPIKNQVQMTMQFGLPPTSEYSYGYEQTPTPGLRQMLTISQITNAMVKTKYAGQYVISQGIRALPYAWDPKVMDGYYLNQMSSYLFPFGLSFLLPTFVSILVQEKEDKHRMMMAMNGLKSSSYYSAHYVEFMTMQLILSLFFCLTCLAVSSQMILRTQPLILIVLLILWAHVQTTLAFFVASFFSNTRRATLMVYFLVAVSCIMASVSGQIFKDGTPLAWFIHPTFSFFNIVSQGIMQSSRVNGLYPMRWADFAAGTILFKCLMLLVGESFLFLLLTVYVDAVAPSEYGVQKPWHFPITSLFNRRSEDRDPESRLHHRGHSANDDSDLIGGDADVYAERTRVQTQYEPAKTPLILDNLFHRYPNKVEPALNGMSFGVETNTVLGLLGPNGAGKSTMIHLLTGLYSPTSGTAHVAGANIRTDMALVHSKIGVCPQHDILWGDLTVADHLLFYSRLRGIPPSLEQQAVTYAIASVSLTKFRDRQVKGLSGGEKRRVSIAISLLGDNKVIFLDEPSTGLDPAVRRVIWEIIHRVKVNKTLVLTTHSMEEADILSDKIAIMTLGRLRCMGTSLHLKDLYGSGFRLNISSKPGRLQEACEQVEAVVLKGLKFKRIDKFTNATTYEFELQPQQQQHSDSGRGQLSKIFSFLSQQPGLFPAIEDWGISQTTLEDVFIKIVTEGDSALAMPSMPSLNH
ncbi:hypothetical protein BGZ83_000029 [Gryganskiella cystojenkinii]|nr:hypothetical protein BGZ83_000029 [Gryganskiella cystojenkinii]